jgi:hypothetical protein
VLFTDLGYIEASSHDAPSQPAPPRCIPGLCVPEKPIVWAQALTWDPKLAGVAAVAGVIGGITSAAVALRTLIASVDGFAGWIS